MVNEQIVWRLHKQAVQFNSHSSVVRQNISTAANMPGILLHHRQIFGIKDKLPTIRHSAGCYPVFRFKCVAFATTFGMTVSQVSLLNDDYFSAFTPALPHLLSIIGNMRFFQNQELAKPLLSQIKSYSHHLSICSSTPRRGPCLQSCR